MGKLLRIFIVLVAIILLCYFTTQKVVPEEYAQVFATTDDCIHFLLLGTDIQEKGMAEIILLCTVDKEAQRVSIAGLSPDRKMATENGENTLRTIYRNGGSTQLVNTLEKNMLIELYGCVEVDFSGIPKVVDALGGVEINGQNRDGAAVMSYLRDCQSDASGMEKQQTAILAVAKELTGASFWKMQKATRKLLPLLDCDMSTAKLIRLGKLLVPALQRNCVEINSI